MNVAPFRAIFRHAGGGLQPGGQRTVPPGIVQRGQVIQDQPPVATQTRIGRVFIRSPQRGHGLRQECVRKRLEDRGCARVDGVVAIPFKHQTDGLCVGLVRIGRRDHPVAHCLNQFQRQQRDRIHLQIHQRFR